MLYKNALSGNLSVFPAFPLRQRVLLRALFRQAGIGMQVGKPQVPCIRFQQGVRQNMSMGFFKQLEIVLLPISKGQADNLPIFEVYQ